MFSPIAVAGVERFGGYAAAVLTAIVQKGGDHVHFAAVLLYAVEDGEGHFQALLLPERAAVEDQFENRGQLSPQLLRKVPVNLVVGDSDGEGNHVYSAPYSRIGAANDGLVVCGYPQLELGLELEFLAVELSRRHRVVARKLL